MLVENIQGIVSSLRLDEEKSAMVLRFVVDAGEQQVPVEMRGQAVRGILELGHEVAIETPGGRGDEPHVFSTVTSATS